MDGEYIYVLLLDSHKYYVGKTTDINRRIEEHKNKVYGSAWTRKYPLREVISMERVKTNHDEDNKVKDLMKEYGIDNVRGGSYSQLVLDESVKRLIEIEINGIKNACFSCGSASHYAQNCPEKNTKISTSESKESNSRKRGLDSTSTYKPPQQEQPTKESYKRNYPSNNNDYSNSKPKIDSNSYNRNYTNHYDSKSSNTTAPPTYLPTLMPTFFPTYFPSFSPTFSPSFSPSFSLSFSQHDYNSTGGKVPYDSKSKNSSEYSSNLKPTNNHIDSRDYRDIRDSKPMNFLGGRSNSNSSSKFPPGHCFRCGRSSHLSPDCYATIDINGEIIEKKTNIFSKY